MERKLYSDKRTSERRSCNALITFSYFNQANNYDARVQNCGAGGMCFQSNQFMQPGATVCIRVKEYRCADFLNDNADCLRGLTLAEVKWCNELSGADSGAYGVGVKYQAPAY